MYLNPTILTDNKQSYIEQVSSCAEFAQEVDIDLIDWKYSRGKTLTAQEMLQVETHILLNFDLMMDFPLSSVEVLLQDKRVRKIIINIRSKENLLPIFGKIKNTGREVAISFSTDEEYEKIKNYFSIVDGVCIFAIEPGAQGNIFRPEMLEYSNRLKRDNFQGWIGLDGGVNIDTIPVITEYPFDRIVSGSAISRAKNPQEAYQSMTNLLESYK